MLRGGPVVLGLSIRIKIFRWNLLKCGENEQKKILKNAQKTVHGLKNLSKGKKLSTFLQKLGNPYA